MREILKKAGYSDKAIHYYLKKVNVGEIKNPDATFTYTGHCGDTMTFFLRIKNDKIQNAKFISTGCSGAFAFGSALTTIIKGKTLEEAKKLTEKDIIKDVGNIPRHKLHCAIISRETLRGAVKKFEKALKTK